MSKRRSSCCACGVRGPPTQLAPAGRDTPGASRRSRPLRDQSMGPQVCIAIGTSVPVTEGSGQHELAAGRDVYQRQGRVVGIQEVQMAHSRYVKPSRLATVLNRALEALAHLGISLYGSRLLAVRGRNSGEWRTTP